MVKLKKAKVKSLTPKLGKEKALSRRGKSLSQKEEKEFRRYLERVEDPNYNGSDTSWALPKNATLLEKTKYEICKQILIYQQSHNLSDEQLAKKIKLTVGETRDILYYHIDCFTLDRLLIYATQLLKSLEIKINHGIRKRGKFAHVPAV